MIKNIGHKLIEDVVAQGLVPNQGWKKDYRKNILDWNCTPKPAVNAAGPGKRSKLLSQSSRSGPMTLGRRQLQPVELSIPSHGFTHVDHTA